MENELEHFPQLIDDEGFDRYPKFVDYYAAGRITNMGSAIPWPKGIPKFYVLKDFTACAEPDPNLVKRKFKCSESTRKPNAAIKVCVYSDLKEWSDADGARMVSVEGFLSNTGRAPLCNLTIDIANLENARAKWGEWLPTFPYYLDPDTSLKFAANIPYDKGFPRVSLKKYQVCPHEEPAEPAAEIPKEETAQAVAGPGPGTGGPAGPAAGGAPPAPDAGAGAAGGPPAGGPPAGGAPAGPPGGAPAGPPPEGPVANVAKRFRSALTGRHD